MRELLLSWKRGLNINDIISRKGWSSLFSLLMTKVALGVIGVGILVAWITWGDGEVKRIIWITSEAHAKAERVSTKVVVSLTEEGLRGMFTLRGMGPNSHNLRPRTAQNFKVFQNSIANDALRQGKPPRSVHSFTSESIRKWVGSSRSCRILWPPWVHIRWQRRELQAQASDWVEAWTYQHVGYNGLYNTRDHRQVPRLPVPKCRLEVCWHPQWSWSYQQGPTSGLGSDLRLWRLLRAVSGSVTWNTSCRGWLRLQGPHLQRSWGEEEEVGRRARKRTSGHDGNYWHVLPGWPHRFLKAQTARCKMTKRL